MTIRMYDLAGADPELRFSPYCWRVRMALKHKQLDFETLPWRFTDKEALAPYYGDKACMVPVLTDGEVSVTDSWNIAEYLEEAYPGKPSLFEGDAGKRHARFLKFWSETQLVPMISRMIVVDILDRLDEEDKAYFRSSREQRLGGALENVVADRENTRVAFGKTLQPMRIVIKEQPFLSGEGPGFGDYAVFGIFQWARLVSPFDILQGDEVLGGWRERMLGLFDGYAGGFRTA